MRSYKQHYSYLLRAPSRMFFLQANLQVEQLEGSQRHLPARVLVRRECLGRRVFQDIGDTDLFNIQQATTEHGQHFPKYPCNSLAVLLPSETGSSLTAIGFIETQDDGFPGALVVFGQLDVVEHDAVVGLQHK